MDKLIEASNNLKAAVRQRDAYQEEVRTLTYHKDAYLGGDDEDQFKEKLEELKQDLVNSKEEYKKIQTDNESKEKPRQDTHEKLLKTKDQHLQLQRQLISIQNGANGDDYDELAGMAIQLEHSKEAYNKAKKADERKHKMKMKYLEQDEKTIDERMEELKSLIQEKEQENKEKADKIKESKKIIKDHEKKKRQEALKKIEEEE